MGRSSVRSVHGFVALALTVACAVACGSSSGGGGSPQGAPPASAAGDDGGASPAFGTDGAAPPGFSSHTITAITVTPASASIESLDGAKVTQAFAAVAQYADGTSAPISSGLTWTAGVPQAGSIDSTGTFTASGSVGGAVPITVQYQAAPTTPSLTASASLTVKLHLHQGVGSVPVAVATSLQTATTPDATVVWAYPYDATVFPRGLEAPLLQWMNGGASDEIFVHVTSPTFELESYAAAVAPGQYVFDPTIWQQLTDSTSGQTTLSVARWSGTAATVIASQTWTIAPASMRGTVYYWANNLGRVMRIKPGTNASDFSAGVVPAPTQGCTMACHTVSADGSSMITAGGTFGGTYDLKTNTMGYGLGGTENSGQIRQWGLSALSPKGDYVVVNALMDQLTGLPADGVFTGAGQPVANSGLSTEKMFMPAFSPDGSGFVFVTGSNPSTAYWLSTGTPGALKAFDFSATGTPLFTNERDIVQPGTDTSKNVIAWPTVSPDGRYATYARLGWVDPSTQHNLSSYAPIVSDLYMADLKNPGTEVRLGNLDGDGYPFAAGARDLHLNFEPSFAPVASGGYFWVVLHSRRTYGNVITGDRTTEKQLWVAAIDQNPVPGKDPSHPAFLLPGQDTTTLNLRGYFALDPCKGDGQGCASGTECCGGYCEGSAGDAGGPVCSTQAPACSGDGDKCSTTSDCCNAAQGTTCINQVCSEAPPR